MGEIVKLTGATVLDLAASTLFPFSALSLDPPYRSGIHSDHDTPVSFVMRVSPEIGWQYGPRGGKEESNFRIGWIRRQMADTTPESKRSISWKWKD
jgi:hypothetical protein